MKKKLFFMAMAGVALAGCVSDDVADVKQQEQKKVKIVFDSPVMYGNSDSRANVYGEISEETVDGSYSYPKDEDFVIYAVSHTGNFTTWDAAEEAEFNGYSISYDINVDGWAPFKVEDDPDTEESEAEYYIWPSGKMMSFAASSPADLENDATRTYAGDGLTIAGFEVKGGDVKHYDLMYSTRIYDQTSANMNHDASYYSGIPILFNHALSSIRFSIANSSDEDLVLKKIEVWGTQYKGDFKENLNESTKSASPEWIQTNDRIAETSAYIGFNGAVPFYEQPRYVSELVAATDVCNQLLLLPQAITNDIKIRVTYTVNGESHTKIVTINDLVDLDNQPVTEWKMGVRYTYRLYYSDESADKDKIYFAPSASDWIEHKVVIVNLL